VVKLEATTCNAECKRNIVLKVKIKTWGAERYGSVVENLETTTWEQSVNEMLW
jgi:hypothetical protein